MNAVKQYNRERYGQTPFEADYSPFAGATYRIECPSCGALKRMSESPSVHVHPCEDCVKNHTPEEIERMQTRRLIALIGRGI